MQNDSNIIGSKGPLAGIRILEVGQLIAGPFTGCILGYFGAEVIKVEAPGDGDRFASGVCWVMMAHHYGGEA